MLARLGLREILNQRRFFILFILNLSLGLMGLVAVEGFRLGMQETFQDRSRDILGADLEISGRTPLKNSVKEKVLQKLPAKAQVREVQGLYNMMKYGDKTRLVNIEAYERGFPFYGGMAAEGSDAEDFREGDGRAWIYPELKVQLGLEKGDELRIGNKTFRVTGVVKNDPRQGMSDFSLAPRVFIRLDDLKETGLLQEGSLVQYSTYFQFGRDFPLDEEFAVSLERIIDDPAFEVETPRRSSEELGRIFDYLTDFLGLVSLVALFLASIGLFYLYRSYLERRRVDMAVYRSLGLQGKHIFGLYLYQLTWLGLIGSLLGYGLGVAFLEVLTIVFSQYLKVTLPWTWGMGLKILGIVLSVGIFGIWLLAIPLLVDIQKVKPLILLQEFVGESEKRFNWRSIVLWLPWVLFYFALAILISHSIRIGSFFFAVILGAPSVLYPFVRGGLKKLGEWAKKRSFVTKMAFLYSARFRTASSISFITLILAGMLLTIIPLMQRGLTHELKGPETDQGFARPSLFLFDIQESQLEDLKKFVERREIQLIGTSPMVRGRLSKVNGEEFDRRLGEETMTREGEREKRFRNRGLNLTYRKKLNPSETIIEGELFDDEFKWGEEEVGEVSVERRYAERLDLELGDVIEVEVLDLPVKAKVTSLRRIRWTSFLPNFFLLFQPGLLDRAPKTYLAAVPDIAEEKKNSFQVEMFENFPGISMVDTSRLVSKVMEIVGQMTKALQVMAIMSSLVGLLVLYSLCSHQMQMKKKDIVLLKSQGLDFKTLKKVFRLEFIGLATLAAFIGSLLGIAVSYTISYLFFDGVWVFAPMIPLFVTLGIAAISWPIVELAMRRTLNTPSRSLLEEVAVGGL